MTTTQRPPWSPGHPAVRAWVPRPYPVDDPPGLASWPGRAAPPARGPAARRRVPARLTRRVAAHLADPGPRTGSFLVLSAVTVTLSLIGLVMVLSASSVEGLKEGSSWGYFRKQLLWLVLGGATAVVVSRLDYRAWRRAAGPLLVGALVLLAVVLVPGVGMEVNGATRWLGWGGLGIQPSELAKLAVLVWLADLLARRADWTDRSELTVRPAMVVLVLAGALIMGQPNLGTTIVLAAIVFVVLFVSGAPLRSLAGYAAAGVSAVVALAIAAPYRRARLTAFMDAWADPANAGYQTIQSQVGLATGGVAGIGLGESRAKWGFLPDAHTDFIFAILGEELGMVGAVVVLVLFLTFAAAGVHTAVNAPDRFGTLLAAGATTWIVVQAFVNIGVVTGQLPVTGVPLPFVSYGGSSMIVTMVAVGSLLGVARQIRA